MRDTDRGGLALLPAAHRGVKGSGICKDARPSDGAQGGDLRDPRFPAILRGSADRQRSRPGWGRRGGGGGAARGQGEPRNVVTKRRRRSREEGRAMQEMGRWKKGEEETRRRDDEAGRKPGKSRSRGPRGAAPDAGNRWSSAVEARGSVWPAVLVNAHDVLQNVMTVVEQLWRRTGEPSGRESERRDRPPTAGLSRRNGGVWNVEGRDPTTNTVRTRGLSYYTRRVACPTAEQHSVPTATRLYPGQSSGVLASRRLHIPRRTEAHRWHAFPRVFMIIIMSFSRGATYHRPVHTDGQSVYQACHPRVSIIIESGWLLRSHPLAGPGPCSAWPFPWLSAPARPDRQASLVSLGLRSLPHP